MLVQLGGPNGPEMVFAPDDLSSAPTVVLTITGDSPAEVTAAQARALGQIPMSLEDLQAQLGVPAKAQVESLPLTVPLLPSPSASSRSAPVSPRALWVC